MASFYSKSVQAKAYGLIGVGKQYGEQGFSRVSIHINPSTDPHREPGKLEVSGFDVGSVRDMFNTHPDARNHLKEIQSGRLEINSWREVDLQTIRIHKFMLDIFAVEFTDEEREIIPIIGALDSLDYSQRQMVKGAFPILEELKIQELPEPKWQTHNGRRPAMESDTYIRVSPEKRELFNNLANPQNALIVEGSTMNATDIHRMFNRGTIYRCGLHGVAEDVGKTLLDVKAGAFDSKGIEILYMRVYDVHETIKPEPRRPPQKTKEEYALMALSQADEAVARTILEALIARGVNPLQPPLIENQDGPRLING